jgi:hypothetical protein
MLPAGCQNTTLNENNDLTSDRFKKMLETKYLCDFIRDDVVIIFSYL